MSVKIKAHLALVSVALIYGANYVVAKGVMPQPLLPAVFILMRVSGAGLMFWMIRIFIKEPIRKEDVWRFAVCGLAGVSTNQLLFFEGLNLTTPLNASIIMTSNPILVMLFASIILKNSITKRKLAGVLFGAIGASLLIWMGAQHSEETATFWGDLMVLGNATSYAVYLVLVKPLMSKYKPITVISWAFLFGWIFVLPFGWSGFLEVQWESITPVEWGSVAFVILGTTFLAYLLNIFALKYVQPTVSSAYIYFQPLFAGLFGWLFAFLGDAVYDYDFGWAKAICTALIFLGVYLVSFQKERNLVTQKP